MCGFLAFKTYENVKNLPETASSTGRAPEAWWGARNKRDGGGGEGGYGSKRRARAGSDGKEIILFGKRSGPLENALVVSKTTRDFLLRTPI